MAAAGFFRAQAARVVEPTTKLHVSTPSHGDHGTGIGTFPLEKIAMGGSQPSGSLAGTTARAAATRRPGHPHA